MERIVYLSQGHPFLVQTLVDQYPPRRGPPADPDYRGHVETAKEIVIIERRSHLDALGDRLREERARRVLGPMLAGESPARVPRGARKDLAYLMDLGLLTQQDGQPRIANPLIETIPRELNHRQQQVILRGRAKEQGRGPRPGFAPTEGWIC